MGQHRVVVVKGHPGSINSLGLFGGLHSGGADSSQFKFGTGSDCRKVRSVGPANVGAGSDYSQSYAVGHAVLLLH